MLYCVYLWSELWIFQAAEKHIFRRTSLWGILWDNSLKYLRMRTHTHKTANFHLFFLPILFQVRKRKIIKGYKVYSEIAYQAQMSYKYYEVSFCSSSQETRNSSSLTIMPCVLGYFVISLHLPWVDQGNKNCANKIITRTGRGVSRPVRQAGFLKARYRKRMRTQEFRERQGSGDQHRSKVKVPKLNPSQLYYTLSHEWKNMRGVKL